MEAEKNAFELVIAPGISEISSSPMPDSAVAEVIATSRFMPFLIIVNVRTVRLLQICRWFILLYSGK